MQYKLVVKYSTFSQKWFIGWTENSKQNNVGSMIFLFKNGQALSFTESNKIFPTQKDKDNNWYWNSEDDAKVALAAYEASFSTATTHINIVQTKINCSCDGYTLLHFGCRCK